MIKVDPRRVHNKKDKYIYKGKAKTTAATKLCDISLQENLEHHFCLHETKSMP